MTAPTLSLAGVCKRFGQLEAVRDVSFEVYPGEIFGLLGPNGAGKTTTIRMMLDIFRPDCGEIRLFGSRLDEASKNRIGYLPEERGLYRDLQLEPVLVYLAKLKGAGREHGAPAGWASGSNGSTSTTTARRRSGTSVAGCSRRRSSSRP